MSDEASRSSWGHRPTIADVGRRADVSATTVSLVLSGQGSRISAATQARVMAAVTELGYRPNRAAQGLRRGRTSTIGFLTDEIAVRPFSGPTVAGVSDLAWQRDSLLLVINTTRDERILEAAIDDLLDRQVDALIYAAIGTRRIVMPSSARSVPTVLVNAYCPEDSLPAIIPDEESGGEIATEHLLALGHRRTAYLAGLPAAYATRARLRGHARALERHDLDPADHSIYPGNYRANLGYELAVEALAGSPRPTALICGNDQMAIGAYIAAARAGLRVPEDVSIIGYDDEPVAADLKPGLTTVRIPFYDMGHQAAQAILSGTVNDLNSRTLMPCVLIERGSVTPPA